MSVPLKQSKQHTETVLKHLGVWSAYTVYFSILLHLFYKEPITIAFVVTSVLFRLGDAFLFYGNALIVLPRFFTPKKILPLILSFTALFGVYFAYRLLVELVLQNVLLGIDTQNSFVLEKYISLTIFNGNTYVLFSFGYFYAKKSIRQQQAIAAQALAIAAKDAALAKQEAAIATLEKEKMMMELAFLRAQINPHFMYNTLNMLYSKVRGASKQVGNLILTFAEMMRYATSTRMQQDTVDLADEMAFVKQYILLQKQRFQDNLQINFYEEGDFTCVRIMPMLLITLMENCFKHGELHDPNHPLKIEAICNDDVFTFRTWNLKKLENDTFFIDKGQTGIGLENIRKRLNLVHGEAQSLMIEENEISYTIRFSLSNP